MHSLPLFINARTSKQRLNEKISNSFYSFGEFVVGDFKVVIGLLI